MPVYLDHASTTPVDARVAASMAEVLSSEAEYGNPASSSHGYGDVAAALVESARAQVAAAVGAAATEIVWTSGATEANNLAIFGVAQYYRERGRHIVTARTEHKAVLDPCRELERRGWEISYLIPDREGLLDPDQVAAALLFGSERYGLATEDLNLCNVLVRIPANPEYCSLNLAMSVQLAAYEIFMAREQPQSDRKSVV